AGGVHMVSRHWKGIVKRDCINQYVAHLKGDTFPQLAALAGFVRATILRRDVASGAEFQVVTMWSSLREIEAFTGANIENAVVPAVAQAMMVEFDRTAVHYEVVDTLEPRAGGGTVA